MAENVKGVVRDLSQPLLFLYPAFFHPSAIYEVAFFVEWQGFEVNFQGKHLGLVVSSSFTMRLTR